MSRRICIVSNIYRAIDEGMAKTAYYLYNNLSEANEVMHVSNMSLNSVLSWNAVKAFKPDIIHHIPGPSLRGLCIGLGLKHFSNSKLVISATRPQLNELFSKCLTKIAKPDFVLVQSSQSLRFFSDTLGCKTKLLSNGVELERFSPVNLTIKKALRKKYNLDPDVFVGLHTGPIRRGRNVTTLAKLSLSKNIQMLMVGSTTTASNSGMHEELINNGCLVWNKYFTNIEELYQLSDLYIFPTFESLNCIETPLSVLEAMSTNLPVVTTKYGALPQLFTEGDGLFFAKDEIELANKIQDARNCNRVQTRKKVLPYSWPNICNRLESFYGDLIDK